ncbi:ribosome biogenesis GTPase Der [Helicobacter sp. 23-1046]
MKSIAILGKPNVGKSCLFNRLCKQKIAITSDISGTTRDIKKGICTISGEEFCLLDTGGIDEAQNYELVQNKKQKKRAKLASELYKLVSQESLNAGKNADLVLYVLDGQMGLDDEDVRHIRTIQRHSALFLVLNKIDNDKIKDQAWHFSSLGIEQMYHISVSHNRGISQLLSGIGAYFGLGEVVEWSDEQSIEDFIDSLPSEGDLPTQENAPDSQIKDTKHIKIGIIGRVNVGKSSLLNALLGQNRSVVSDLEGTTLDPVNEVIELDDFNVEFIDTAGIRRAGKIEGLEKYALMRTNQILEQSHIALLVLDCSSAFVELDEKIASLTQKHNLGVIIVLNKYDITKEDFKTLNNAVRTRFKFLYFAPIICVSALNKRNIAMLKNEILKVWQHFMYRIPTSALNDLIMRACAKHHLPSDRGKIVKIYYATQFESCPPQISLVMNRPNALHFSYKRYLINCLREEFGFSGVPIIINAKGKKE